MNMLSTGVKETTIIMDKAITVGDMLAFVAVIGGIFVILLILYFILVAIGDSYKH